jgi:hypothetical protein
VRITPSDQPSNSDLSYRAERWIADVASVSRQIPCKHKQRIKARLAERDDRISGRANDWLAVVEGRIDDERHAGSRKEIGYEFVKIWI